MKTIALLLAISFIYVQCNSEEEVSRSDSSEKASDELFSDSRDLEPIRSGGLEILEAVKREINKIRVDRRGLRGMRVGKRGLRGMRVGKRGLQGMRVGKRGLRGMRVGKRGLRGMRVGKRGLRGMRVGKRVLDAIRTSEEQEDNIWDLMQSLSGADEADEELASMEDHSESNSEYSGETESEEKQAQQAGYGTILWTGMDL